MKYKNLSEKVQALMSDCDNQYISIVNRKDAEPLKHNQRETIKKINCYINNEYTERDDDAIFWNLSTYRRTHFAKLLAADTKDFTPIGLGQYNYWHAWALRKKLKQWFYDSLFYQVLNDIPESLATYGSTIWKIVKENGEIRMEEVDLLNCYFDQRAKTLCHSDGFVELHKLNQGDIIKKKGIWKNTDKLLELAEGGQVDVWEYWGYWSEDGKNYKYIHQIGSNYGKNFIDLWSEETSEDEFKATYHEFHIGTYSKRWLRIGVVERLFDLQTRVNQLVNQNAQSTEIASLLLLQTTNPDMVGNVLEQAQNGQIIPDDTLKQIGITNAGLYQFTQELQMIENQADKLCLTPDVIQGEQAPSGTPFRSTALVSQSAVNAFTAYHQNFVEKMAYILMEYILPYIVKKLSKADVIEMAEDDADIEQYDKAVIEQLKKVYLLSGAGPITPEVEQMITSAVDTNIGSIGRKVELDNGWIDFKYKIIMTPSSEQVDKQTQNQTYTTALQMVQANPIINNIPLFKQFCENNGISWWKLSMKQVEQMVQANTHQLPMGQIPNQENQIRNQAKLTNQPTE